MKASLFPVLLCLLTCEAMAQDSTGPLIRRPPPTSTPFVKYVRAFTKNLGLLDLRESKAPEQRRELRICHGFGVWGVELLVVRETPAGWRAYRAYPVPPDTTPGLVLLRDTVNWRGRWDRAVAAGLPTLPSFPARPESDSWVTDGYSAVLEWFDGQRYGIAGANSPDVYCSPDDRRLLAVIHALLRRDWVRAGRCPL